MSGTFAAIIGILNADGTRADAPDSNGAYKPIMLKAGAGVTWTAADQGSVVHVTATSTGGSEEDGQGRDTFEPTSTVTPTWQPLFTMPTDAPHGATVKVSWTKTKRDTGGGAHEYTSESDSVTVKALYDGTNTTSTLPSLGLSSGAKKILQVDTDTYVVARLGDTDPRGALTLITYTAAGVAETVAQLDGISEIVDMAWDRSTLVVAGTAFGVSYLYVVSVEGLVVVGSVRLNGLIASAVDVIGDRAAAVGVVVSRPTFMIVDITDRAAPEVVGELSTLSGSPIGVLFYDAFTAYSVAYNGTTGYIEEIDVSTPAAPSVAGTLTSKNKPWAMCCREITGSPRDYFYAVYEDNLAVIDVSTTPTAIAGEDALTAAPLAIVYDTDEECVYYAAADGSVGSVDVSTPAAPAEDAYDATAIPDAFSGYAFGSIACMAGDRFVVGVGSGIDQPFAAVFGTPPAVTRPHRVPAVGSPVVMAKAWDDPVIYLAAFKDAGVGTVTTKVEYVVEWSTSEHP